MASLVDRVSHLVRWLHGMLGHRRAQIGGTEIGNARRLADAERALAIEPDGCAWLDDRTLDDLDLPLVFRAIDRTVTPTGAQVLWRWLAAPASQLEILTRRERKLALLADPDVRERITNKLAGAAAADAPHLPRLLWEPASEPLRAITLAVLLAALLGFAVLSRWWPPLAVGAIVVFGVNVFVDDWANLRFAHQARAIEVLARVLDAAARVASTSGLPEPLVTEIRDELVPRAALRKRVALLTARDPFGLLDLIRAGCLIRLCTLRSAMRVIEAERDRLRRIVLWIGELDALTAVARLRAERRDLRVPELQLGPPHLAAHAIAHPAITGAIGNDLALDASSLLVTGSNMSGKSTFLRTVAINAILAQSIHTTVGDWRASILRVYAVMRIGDDIANGLSTYAVEVAAVGELVKRATERDECAALFVVDEPFNGTNPAIRVPIVVSVLEHLAKHDLVVAATHDLDVATLLDDTFERGYFAEVEGATFDRKLRPGVAPSTNAIELLRRAGYPASILESVAQRACSC